MNSVVFVYPRVEYPSYTDYRRLVQCSGFESCFGDQMDPGRNCTYVISPIWSSDFSDCVSGIARLPRCARMIWWFLERPIFFGPRPENEMADIMLGRGFDEVWLSDRYFYNRLPADPRFRFVPVGSDEVLASGVSSAKLYDFCHLSLIYGRRDSLYRRLPGTLAPNGFGAERDRILQASRFMLNVHQDEDPVLEGLRFAVAAANRIPLISESCGDPFPFVEGEDFLSVPYHDLPARLERLLEEGPVRYADMAERMFRKAVRDFRFADNVRHALTKSSPANLSHP